LSTGAFFNEDALIGIEMYGVRVVRGREHFVKDVLLEFANCLDYTGCVVFKFLEERVPQGLTELNEKIGVGLRIFLAVPCRFLVEVVFF